MFLSIGACRASRAANERSTEAERLSSASARTGGASSHAAPRSGGATSAPSAAGGAHHAGHVPNERERALEQVEAAYLERERHARLHVARERLGGGDVDPLARQHLGHVA